MSGTSNTMRCHGLPVFVFATVIAMASVVARGADKCDAVRYQNTVYVALDDLASALGATTELTQYARGVAVKVGEQSWELANGGDRIIGSDGKTHRLERPALVIGGRHFLAGDECAAVFGYVVEDEPPAIRIGEQRLLLEPKPVDSPYQGRRVAELKFVHEVLRTTGELPARRALHADAKTETLPAGRTLLVRRSFTFDGNPLVLAVDCGAELQSYAIAADALRERTTPATLDGSAWQLYRTWFDEQTPGGFGLQTGRPKQLEQSVAVTVDLCWSLRSYEERFFQALPALARQQARPIHPVIFISGRWLDQHPTEMHALLALDEQPGVELIWGHHSWDHPKAGKFMNDYTPKQLRADTLRLEQRLLEWGVVPSAYYRFPGLIHDATRLRTMLALDLLPIDCDCWMALVRPARPDPFYHPASDGSIILVHGNGNEARGITAFEQWLTEHADWRWAPLHEFLPQE